MSALTKRAIGLRILALALGAMTMLPGAAAAHDVAMPLASYGNFGPAYGCQRAISRATRLCFEAASRGQIRCANASLEGGSCDFDIGPAQQRASDIIARGCTENHARILGFFGIEDAQLDLANSCTQQAEALKTLLYGPAMFSGAVAPGPENRDQCLKVVSRYGYKIARTALRERNRAFLRMAAGDMPMSEKQAALTQTEDRIEDLWGSALSVIRAKCTDAEFAGSYGMSFEQFADRLLGRSDCVSAASHVVDAVSCPPPACGNAVKEPGEECDDGNGDDGDACDTDCKRTSCQSFASTYDLIQHAIFENKGCTQQFCHGSTASGGLDLRAPQSYDQLVNAKSSPISPLDRVEPLSAEQSFLARKLAAATLGTPVEGSPMPSGGIPPLTTNELEAIRLWIYSGAPRTGVVDGTATLLDACLPPADPIQIDPPPPPPEGQGVQLRMPKLDLPPESETEVCYASYYDLTDQVPEGVDTVFGAFRYQKKVETQDPLSHHLIIHTYLGEHGPEHPAWGAWTCKGGLKEGQTCDPKDLDFCGAGVCGSEPKRSVACIGFGPPDYNATTAPAFGGSQQPLAVSKWAEGVYSQIPIKGMVIWNSHAFNTTKRPAKVEAWVNFDFAFPEDQQYPVQGGILDPDNRIFAMNVPAFQEQEVCHQFTFPQGARLFELTSHMHSRGRLFRIWNPQNELIYTSTQYNDPIQLTFDPPLELDGASAADRTYRYCAIYDNGKSEPARVKRRTGSPLPPPPFPPTRCSPTHCVSGKPQAPCSGSGDAARNASCDSSPGAGDGLCDACTLRGGVTTEDEMFLFLAYYYCSPDFPETCKDEYGFLNGGNQGGGSSRTAFTDTIGLD